MSEPPNDDVDREGFEREARELLGEVREPVPVPSDARARAFARLVATLPVDGSGGGSHGGSGGAGLPPSPMRGGLLARAFAARVPAWSLLASFVAGGAVAASIASRPAPSAPAMEARLPPSVVASAAPSETVSAVPAAPSNEPVPALSAASAARPAVTSASSAPRLGHESGASASAQSADGALEEERSLLDVARTAVGRGDGASALRAAEVHARRFPRGVLAEEREAMTIQALRLLRREDEARTRLERFRGRYPGSLMRPALEGPSDAGVP